MWLWPVFDWVKANKWAQFVLITLATILTVGIYLALRDNGVRQQERMRQEVENARERARIAEARKKITQENKNAAERVDQAVDSLERYRHTDELRSRDPAAASVVLGTDPRRGS